MPLLSCFGGKTPPKQVVMLGLAGAGKTTLLYTLLMGNKLQGEYNQKISKLVTDMKEQGDISYHYEELPKTMGHYGVWDVPGSLSAVWPTFYRYIRITATIFVVNASEEAAGNESELRDAARVLKFLLNEDELRQAAFIVIINERPENEGKGTKKGKKKKGKERQEKVNVPVERVQC